MEDKSDKVWKKGLKEYKNKPSLKNKRGFRYDAYGNLMKKSEYGNYESELGWEGDHIKPSSRGGKDTI